MQMGFYNEMMVYVGNTSLGIEGLGWDISKVSPPHKYYN